MKRLLLPLTAILLIALGLIWGCQKSSGGKAAKPNTEKQENKATAPATSPTVSRQLDNQIRLTVVLPKKTFSLGESIPIKLVIKNLSSKIAQISYSSSQHYDFHIIDLNKKPVWSWSRGRVFAQTFEELQMLPNASTVFRSTWKQQDDDGNPVKPGYYWLIAGWKKLPTAEKVKIKLKIVSNQEGKK